MQKQEANTNLSTSKPYAVYVHGLGSGAASTTIQIVRKIFPDYEWHAVEVNENPYESVAKIDSFVKDVSPSIIMGTSLGGYYVFYANAPETVKIICNPAMNIETDIRQKIGLGTHKYFVERENGETEFVLTEETCDRFSEYRQTHPAVLGKENYAVFAAHDEMIGDSGSLDNMAMVFDAGYSILIDSKSGHRLRKQTLKLLKQYLNI